ncbi:tetratricopeptide repeat protein [Aequorivita sediminis]|uniref:tetratricopeptide repeat protein n=1 Tax=Aequorivita sediminis TaxID=3073653 RepID=UPI0028AAA6FB|nr:hypothetical protein [Aequorivita sp. F6058]
MKYLVPLLLLLILSCKQQEKETGQLGVVNISVSGKKSAQPHFKNGLLLLHSFEYEDARDAFKMAQEEDSEMVMAYWGEAMSYNHSLWQEQDYKAATTALNKLDKINFINDEYEIEQDLIKAVRILYEPRIDKTQRDINYSNYMEELHNKYPDNQEISAFYALSLLGSVAEGRDDGIYGKGAKVAKGILNENPKHPGALHYLIHSYDDPEHANLALNAANIYSKVAPDASHALHMPSHIYVAMGMWDNVISSNIDSYQASLNRMEKKGLDNDARGYHAFHWLEYGYLQKGNYEEARKMVLDMQKYATEKPSKMARTHLVFLKGTYLAETDEWDSDIANIALDINDLNITIRSEYHFIEGMKAYTNGNLKKLDSVIDVMEQDYNRESFVVSEGSSKLCSAVTRDEANEMVLKEAKIRQNQLLALHAKLKGDSNLAEQHFKESISIENSISYSFGPPTIHKPTHELYADWLLSQNRNEEAAAHYNLALQNGPGRLRVLKGIENSKQVI